MIQAPENDCTSVKPPTHTLYISARGLCGAEGSDVFSQSPVAILDCFVGYQHEHNALRWMEWMQPSAIFQCGTVSFATLFLHIATSKENLDEVSSFQ